MIVYVIVPIFNTEKYLKKCLESLYNQTYIDYCVICVNDGSTDQSLSIVDSYCKNCEKFVCITKNNGGLASSRNAGLDYISDYDHCYITFVDSDDWVESNYIDRLVNAINESDSDIVCSSYFDTYENNKIDAPYYIFKNKKKINNIDGLILNFEGKIQSHSPTKLYKGSLWKNLRFDETVRFMEDERITFRLFENAQSIFYIPYAGYYYLHRLGSLCQSKMTNSKIIDALEAYLFAYSFEFTKIEPDCIDFIKEKVLQNFARIYLMMYPRFNFKNASNIEKDKWSSIITFERRNKAVKIFLPFSKKEYIKKYVFLVSPFLYTILFRFFLKKYDH